MLKQFWMDLRLQKSGWIALLCTVLGAAAAGMIMVALIMNLDSDPGSWFCMGTLLSLVVGGMFLLIQGAFGYQAEFQLALSMGRTRTAFMGAYVLRLLMEAFLVWGLTSAVHGLELTLYPVWYAAYENEVLFRFLSMPQIMVPAVLGLCLLAMFIGALYGRYGRKGLAGFYFLWLVCCFGLPRLVDLFESEPKSPVVTGILGAVMAVPLPVWIAFGAAVILAMVATTVILGRKQMVKI